MTLRRFFRDSARLQSERPSLEGEEAKHILRVLRLGPGDRIVLFDNSGWEYEARISGAQWGRFSMKCWKGNGFPGIPAEDYPRRSPDSSAAPGMDFSKRHRTGSPFLLPLHPFHSGRNFSSREWEGKQERWKRIITEAAKQCGRNRLPGLMVPCSFDQVLEIGDPALRILPYEGENLYTLKEIADRYPETGRVMTCIGPEGGFQSGRGPPG